MLRFTVSVNHADGTLVGRAHERGVCLEGLRYLTLTGYRRHGACGKLLIAEAYIDGTVRYVNVDDITSNNLTDITTCSSLGRDMSDAEARCTTREAAVGAASSSPTQVLRLDVRGGIEHLLHTRPSLGTFVSDDYHIACYDIATEDTLYGSIL